MVGSHITHGNQQHQGAKMDSTLERSDLKSCVSDFTGLCVYVTRLLRDL